ncbi:MAG TPA: LysR family transcriptional regulator [Stellaceae bacterium]
MVNLPSFRQLEHLVLLADHGHFGRAAKIGHVTQSTLSASIKNWKISCRRRSSIAPSAGSY